MADQQSTTDFKLTSVLIFPLGNDKDGLEIKNLVYNFSYIENITSPFVAGTLSVADSAGLLNDLPIQGGETVKIAVNTSTSKDPVEYVLNVYKIGNRFAKNQMQSYTLGLVSLEALNNEYYRVRRKFSKKADEIIAEILNTDLKTKKVLYSEPTRYSLSYIPPNKRPFDIFSSLAIKSVSAAVPISSTSSANKNKTGKETVKGTAGFFFWETRRGYNFFAVDSLLSDEPVKNNGKVQYDVKPWGPYIEKIVNSSDGADDRFTIINATFSSELDVITSMRKGRYSSSMSFFNHSTGQYKPLHYSLAQNYDQMKHLGPQNKPNIIKVGKDKTLSDYPTRIMTFLLDHETWFNDPQPASNDPKDGSSSPSQFCDEHMNYAAQAITRYELLQNQTATIVIPGNSEICAGDKINIKLVNKLSNVDQNKQPYDPESSGVYLIREITHTYEATVSTNGRFTSTLRLMRDSFGDIESKHGQ